MFLLVITWGNLFPFMLGWVLGKYWLMPTYKCQYCNSPIPKHHFRATNTLFDSEDKTVTNARDLNKPSQANIIPVINRQDMPNIPVPSISEELEKLAALKTNGVITVAEFEAKKKQILGI